MSNEATDTNLFLCSLHAHRSPCVILLFPTGCTCEVVWLWLCQNWSRRLDDPSVHSLLRSTSGKERMEMQPWRKLQHISTMFVSFIFIIFVQVLEAQRRHQKEKSGIIPTSPTPYTYNKVRPQTGWTFLLIYCFICGLINSKFIKFGAPRSIVTFRTRSRLLFPESGRCF